MEPSKLMLIFSCFIMAVFFVLVAIMFLDMGPTAGKPKKPAADKAKEQEEREKLLAAITLIRQHLCGYRSSYEDSELCIDSDGDIRWKGDKVGFCGDVRTPGESRWETGVYIDKPGEWIDYVLKLADSCAAAEARFQQARPIYGKILDTLNYVEDDTIIGDEHDVLHVYRDDHDDGGNSVGVDVDDEPVLRVWGDRQGLCYLDVYRPGKWEGHIDSFLERARAKKRELDEEAYAKKRQQDEEMANLRKANFSPINDEKYFQNL